MIIIQLLLFSFSALSQTGEKYYYSNGNISVDVSPWEQETRMISFYDRAGNVSYTMQNVRQSYSVNTKLYFDSSGFVTKAVTNTNPGASRYTYTSTISFDDNNTPLWLTKESTPLKDDALFNGSPSYYWDVDSQKWIRQKSVKEQDTPRRYK